MSRRLGLTVDLDIFIQGLLDWDKSQGQEYDDAENKTKVFSLAQFENYRPIEKALGEYIFSTVLNEIYRKKVKNDYLYGRATSGLLFENVAQAVVRTRLRRGYSCRFIDRNGVDFAIYNKMKMITGIQCKALLEKGKKSRLSAHEFLRKFQGMRNHFEENNHISFCLFVGYFSKFTREETEEFVRTLSKEKLRVFRVFADWNDYTIDNSMKAFVEFINNILTNREP